LLGPEEDDNQKMNTGQSMIISIILYSYFFTPRTWNPKLIHTIILHHLANDLLSKSFPEKKKKKMKQQIPFRPKDSTKFNKRAPKATIPPSSSSSEDKHRSPRTGSEVHQKINTE
jgi:hypothetical protein